MAVPISFLDKPPIAITAKLHFVSSFSIASPPSKPFKLAKRRRNSLRPKILTKPYSPPPNPKTVPAEENDISVAVVPVENDIAPVAVSGKSLAMYGLYLIGAFLFQTVFAVWMVGNSSSDWKVESLGLNGSDSDSDSDKEMVSLNNENVNVNLNGIQLEEKIDEIRVLARQARKNEKSKNIDSNSRSKIEVERVVGNRLLKLRKSLNSSRDKLPGSYVNYLSEFGSGSDPKMGNESLMFKKKYKVRSYSVELGESPNGFGASGKKEEIEGGELSLSHNDRNKMEGPKGFGGSVKNKAAKGKNSTRRVSEGKGASVTRKPVNGVIQEIRLGVSSAELADSKELSDSRIENGQVSRSSGDESSRRNETEKKLKTRKVPEERLKNGSDMWWINLPYVLVILMQRDSEPEVRARIYTLTVDNEAYDEDDDDDEDFYAVAFEDRGDASNFCILLESFFEDLGDFSADIVPMTVKELQTAIKREGLKVIVVKKGQLRLYIGQPLQEVELALQALVEKEAQSNR